MAKRKRRSARECCEEIVRIIVDADKRAMRADGPVTRTLDEMTQHEIIHIYRLARDGARKY